MVRLIDADALIYAVDGNPLTTDSLKEYVRSTVKAQPTVDAVPVRHGKWIQVGHIEHMQIVYKCSACNGQTIVDGNFCPNCGARMDGDRDEPTKRL